MQDTPHAPQLPADDEIDLLDLLATVADNIKLLIIGPMVATSAAVLDPVSQALGLGLGLGLPQQGLSVDQARSRLQGQVKASVGRSNKLLSITTTATSPAAAQQLNQLVLQQVFEQTRPRGAEQARLQARLQQEQTSFATSTQLEQTLAKQLAPGKAGDRTSETYAVLLASNSARLVTIQTLEAQLAGLQPSDMV